MGVLARRGRYVGLQVRSVRADGVFSRGTAIGLFLYFNGLVRQVFCFLNSNDFICHGNIETCIGKRSHSTEKRVDLITMFMV